MDVINWPTSRSVEDLVVERVQEFVGDNVTYMFSKPNPKCMLVLTSGRERLVMGGIVNRLVESVHPNDANVRGDTIKFGERDLAFKDSQEI